MSNHEGTLISADPEKKKKREAMRVTTQSSVANLAAFLPSKQGVAPHIEKKRKKNTNKQTQDLLKLGVASQIKKKKKNYTPKQGPLAELSSIFFLDFLSSIFLNGK